MKGNKYHAKSVVVDGERFDSYAEYQRWEELKLLEKAGEIRNLERQVKIDLMIEGRPIKIRSEGYPNGRRVSHRIDFAYFEGRERVFEDKKGNKRAKYVKGKSRRYGTDSDNARLKRAIVEAMYPGVQVRIT